MILKKRIYKKKTLKKNFKGKNEKLFIVFLFFCYSSKIISQTTDSSKTENFSLHFQSTLIAQYKPSFNAAYSGDQSLQPESETQRSFTSTLFAGMRVGKNGGLFINPEIAYGAALSKAYGVAASSNGETYRVDSVEHLTFTWARVFYSHVFPLTDETNYQSGDLNILGKNMPTKYFKATVGKISLADFFDINPYSHDPRSQFISWGLMGNGAWDYPADVKGYTPSIVLEYFTPNWEFREAVSLEPLQANGAEMNWNALQAHGQTFEITHHFNLGKKSGSLRLLGFYNTANMGSYAEALVQKPINPDVIATRQDGRTKYGLGISTDLKLNDWVGAWTRLSWSDGNNETWAFTEIDRSISGGLNFDGKKWHRNNDNIGFAIVASGLSDVHRRYLAAGGKGFELGDGQLNYGLENLTEIYYMLDVWNNKLKLTGVYQFLNNPGYNQSRGPVSIFSLRLHLGL